ncbi:MAG: hypothetical protein J6X66_07840 [Lachnospiraceae bacterium]|nr:hypothetical protein [Lachnospiraceae bacterium]
MLGLSDRDSKIILVLLIVAIIALPYVLYTKGLREDTEVVKGENVNLEARLEELQEMNKNRDFYVAETERMKKERDKLIDSFPAEVDQENYTMFLQYLEYNAAVKAAEQMAALLEDEEDLEEGEWPETPRFGYKGIDGNTTVLVQTVGYGESDYIAISDEGSDEALTGVINDSTVVFTCYQEGLKYLLDYIMNYEDPMIYKTLTVEYDDGTGQLEGTMLLEQYAIAGQGRKLDNVAPWPDIDEEELRGIVEEGLFGPIDPDTLYVRQMFEAYLEELKRAAEEAEEEDNAGDFAEE